MVKENTNILRKSVNITDNRSQSTINVSILQGDGNNIVQKI